MTTNAGVRSCAGTRRAWARSRPYIAELGPGDWSVIEDWLAVQLGRPMALPDLSARGFFTTRGQG
ncbi:MAG: hypothetical protein R3F54_24400 [Alphaproteobacteria bacterium]